MPDFDGMIEELQTPFSPVTAADLKGLVEAFPEYFRLLADRLRELADHVPEQDPSLSEVGAQIANMAVHAGAAKDAAEQAALEFGERARFWGLP